MNSSSVKPDHANSTQHHDLDALLYPALLVLVRAGLTNEELDERYKAALSMARSVRPAANLHKLPNVETTREVISTWTTDPRFQTNRGSPRTLKKQGINSFQSLVESTSSEADWEDILRNLVLLENVEVTSSNRIRLLRKFLMVKTPGELAYEPTLRFISDACRAASAPLDGGAGSAGTDNYWRVVELSGLTAAIEKRFYGYTKIRTLQLLQELNEWLIANRASIPSSVPRSGRKRVGLGVFFVSERES